MLSYQHKTYYKYEILFKYLKCNKLYIHVHVHDCIWDNNILKQ